jgi:hypothetical protein
LLLASDDAACFARINVAIERCVEISAALSQTRSG